jgi:hypothetical protein
MTRLDLRGLEAVPTERSSERCRSTGHLILMATRSLIDDETVVIDVGHCRDIARALADVLKNSSASRGMILAASPFVIERSGRVKTLVEMIEQAGDDEAANFQLARLLLRALEWA